MRQHEFGSAVRSRILRSLLQVDPSSEAEDPLSAAASHLSLGIRIQLHQTFPMGFRGCCTFPHGQATIWAMALAIIAYVLAVNSTYRCFYWIAEQDPTNTLSKDSVGIGLFSHEAYNSEYDFYFCTTYTQEEIQALDAPFVAAYSLAVAANFFIGISMILLFVVCCCDFTPCVIKSIGACSLFGGLCMALTFVSYASFITGPPYNAKFSVASGTAIGTVIAAFLAGALACKAPPATEPLPQTNVPAFAPGTVTTTETVMPDGSKKIVKTTVNPDGSQTVTETIEQTA